ncbi:tape measure protein [Corynebacterium sp.]|uniref:tape measure protein n=1 Tax=Corynebacterium sp. TaxID=1720 RepID=UPI0026DC9A28|nr:tape measure protein [Corynebacterium sp.]MDO4610956.1 tape measure protein [Corynebacterium sp.]
MSTVGTAKIVFEADASKVSEQLQKSLSRVATQVGQTMSKTSSEIKKGAGEAGQALGDKVSEGADRASKAVGSIDGKGLDRVQQAATKAGQAVASRISDGSAKAASSTSKIGEAAGRAAESSGSAFDRLRSRISGAFSSASGAAARAGTAVRSNLNGALAESERTALRIPSALGRIAGTAVAIAGPAAVLKGGFDRLMNIQRAEIMFKSVGLSAGETKAQMAKLSEQVTGTAVSLSDAAKYSAMFAQSGVELGKPMDAAIKAFTSLSSIAEGSGVDVGRVMQQISAQGKVTGGDIQQLADAGVNATKYLADHMGMSQEEIKKAISDGKVSFEDFVAAINEGTGDLAKQMGQTLPAKISNLKTALANLGAAIIEPFIPGITAAVEFGTAIIKGAVGPLKRFAAWLKEGSAPAQAVATALKVVAGVALGFFVPAMVAAGWSAAKAGAQMAWAWVTSAAKAWPAMLQQAQALALTAAGWVRAGVAATINAGKVALAWIIAAPKNVGAGIVALGQLAAGWARAGVAATVNAAKVAAGWLVAMWPVALIVGAIAGLIAIFVALWTRCEGFRDFWIGLWETIKSAASAAWEWLKGLFTGDGFFARAWDGLVDAATWAWEGVKVVWGAAVDFFSAVFGGIRDIITGLLDGIAALFTWLWDNVLSPMVSGIQAAWSSIAETLAPVIEWIRGLWSGLVEELSALWETYLAPVFSRVAELFSAIGEAIGNFVSEHWETIKSILLVLGGVLLTPIIIGLGLVVAAVAAVAAAVTAVIWVLSKFVEILVGIPGFVSGVVTAVGGWFADLWRGTKEKFSQMGEAVSGWWRNHVAPLPGRIGEAIGGVIRWFQSLPGRIRSALSDAGSWLVGVGRNIVQGLINGISGFIGRAVATARSLASQVKNAAMSALGIHSPSRVFMEIGEHVGEGMALGMERSRRRVADAAAVMAGSAETTVPVPSPTAPASPTPVTTPPAGEGAASAAGALSGMAESLAAAQAAVLDPMWAQAQAGVQQTAATVAQQSLGVMAPTWAQAAGMMQATRTQVMAPAMAGVQQTMAATAAQFPAQVWGVISPALQGLNTTLWWVKNQGTDPVFRAMTGGLQWVVATFSWAVGQIGALWSRVREATAQPVRFTIQSVFNDGLVGMWNSVAELLGTTRMAPYPVRFATGGFVSGPGGPTDDLVPAMLSDGEYVLRADAVRRIGVDNLNAMNSGHVGAVPGALRSRRAQEEMLNDLTFRRVASRYSAGGIVKGTPAWEALWRGYRWAQSRSGRPYVFGGSAHGSGGTDCSGFMSGIANVILGGDGRRQWATGTFPGPQRGSWAPGLAAGFSVGIRNGGPGGGHTAGTIGGVEGMPAVNVESGGSPSRVKFGAGAVGATDSYFNQHHHLRVVEGGQFVPGSGSGVSMADMVASAMRPHIARMNAAVAGYRGAGRVGQLPRLVKNRLEKAAKAKIDKLVAQLEVDPGGSGVERWAPLVKWLLNHYGHPQSWLSSTLRRMRQESGGNPRAVNNWDINARNGDPSKGLMQVIGSTFRAYRDPAFPNDIWNPKSNVAASMRYAMARYGSLPAAYDRAGGYHRGGLLPPGQGVFEKTALAPERVLSPRQTESFERLVDWLDATRRPSIPAEGAGTGRAYGDGRVTRQVLVTQNITGHGAAEVADEVEDRILALMI